MAPARLSAATPTRNLVQLEVSLVGDIPFTIRGIVQATLIDQVLEQGTFVFFAKIQKDSVDFDTLLSSGTGNDQGELIQSCFLDLL